MADLSLDDYIQKSGFKSGSQRGGLRGRGASSRGRGNSQGMRGRGGRGNIQRTVGTRLNTGPRKPVTQFSVTGLGKVQRFDARQKLSQKTVKDAREKIIERTKFVDARVRIQSKKTQPPSDAREKIKARKGPTTPQITVTGLGQGDSTGINRTSGAPAAPLTRTVPGKLTRTLDNDQVVRTNHTVQCGSSGIVITANPKKSLQDEEDELLNTPVRGLGPIKKGPIIQIRNDMYREQIKSAPIKVSQSSGPLRFTPITPPKGPSALKPTRLKKPVTPPAAPVSTASIPKRGRREEEVPVSDVISPLQGFRVLVTNLHPIVSQDDVIELFGAVGALKKARMVKQGAAEVVFVKKDDAVQAIKKYHLRELDGQPMQVRLASSIAKPPTAAAPAPLPITIKQTPAEADPHPTGQPLKLAKSDTGPLLFGKGGSSGGSDDLTLDSSLIHKALFKTTSKDDKTPNRPVTFTVKI